MKKIIFGSMSEYYLETPELHPIPIKDYKMDWYKNMPRPKETPFHFDAMNISKNVKACPSFTDIFENGFVVLAPTDYFIHYLENGDFVGTQAFSFRDSLGIDDIQYHFNGQLIQHLPKHSPYKLIVKINLPLKVFTPDGYSLSFMRMPFSDHTDFEAIYGNLRADKIHHLSIQCGIKHNKQILIKQGTPLALLVPFKREKFKHKVIDINKPSKYRSKWVKKYLSTYGSWQTKYKSYYWSD